MHDKMPEEAYWNQIVKILYKKSTWWKEKPTGV